MPPRCCCPRPTPTSSPGPAHQSVLDALAGGQALFFRQLAEATSVGAAGTAAEADLLAAVWDLVWAGLVSNDTMAPVRALLAGGGAHRAKAVPRSRYRTAPRLPASRLGRASLAAARSGPPSSVGRWYLLPGRDPNPTRRATALAENLLDRHGVVTRGAVMSEGAPGGFAAVYPVLAAMEERGAARRGYFVEGLGAAQFAVPGAVDRLRALDAAAEEGTGRARPSRGPSCSPRPIRPTRSGRPCRGRSASSTKANPGRATGRGASRARWSLTVEGELVLYVERGGRTLLSFVDDLERLTAAAAALAEAVRSGVLGPMSVERADGEAIHDSPLREALTAAGFRTTPRGLRLRA